MNVGDRVRLVVPDNPRLHGASAVVEAMTGWGAHVGTEAAATGAFRALHCEMEPLSAGNGHAKEAGYTGDSCGVCGSLKMLRKGPCLCCQECGSTSGGCS